MSFGFFQDSDGNKSFGRLESFIFGAFAFAAFAAGLHFTNCASYCLSAIWSFSGTALMFYAVNKGQQFASNWLGKAPGAPTEQTTDPISATTDAPASQPKEGECSSGLSQ